MKWWNSLNSERHTLDCFEADSTFITKADSRTIRYWMFIWSEIGFIIKVTLKSAINCSIPKFESSSYWFSIWLSLSRGSRGWSVDSSIWRSGFRELHYFIGIFPARTSWFVRQQNRGHMFSDSDSNSDSQFVEIWFRQEMYRCHLTRPYQTGISLSSLILDELSWLNLKTILNSDICFWILLPVSWDSNEISSRRDLNDFSQISSMLSISSFWS
jgi:hypothetical protein